MFSKLYSKFVRVTSNQLYFPEIDGIRFVAIILVVLFHIHGYFMGKMGNSFADSSTSHPWVYNFFTKGDRGVELFFVLSGFILCLPFAHQYINDGKKIELKKYYIRRVTRLEPPYIIAITSIFILQLAMHVNPGNLTTWQLFQHYFASLTYTHDLIYWGHTPIITVVAWSLEIEIQFYVMAPLFFRLLSLPKITRRIILVSLILFFIAVTAPLDIMDPISLTIYKFIKYFFIGILLADFYVSNTAVEFFNKKWIAPACALLLVILCVIPKEDELYGKLSFPFLIGLFYYIVLKNEQVKKIFSYKFVPIIGGMCYSIYLLHYTVISIFGRFTTKIRITDHYLPNLYFQMVVLSLIALVISSVFYLYIERPFMDKKWMKYLIKEKKQVSSSNEIIK